ncbi:MAG: sporulation protein YqfD [Clostridia bacterium]|nr:sporulation protein YqfD [Clostridia bacterium]
MWNFLSGYVMIQAEGKNPERLINKMIAQGFEIWNLSRAGANAITFNIILSDFYKLRKTIRRQGIKIRILEKHGLFVHLLALRYRKVLLVGWAVVLLLLLFASRNIWVIKVNGCDTLKESEVIAMLDEMDIGIGTAKNKLITSSLGKRLIECDERIAWAGANISGVVLRIDIHEAVPSPINDDEGKSASIYASASGKVKRVTALYGKPCVKKGDIVQKGDLLITGDLSSETVQELYVRARGEVIADVVYTFSAIAPTAQLVNMRTGKYVDTVHVRLFSLSLYEDKSGFELSEEEYRSTQVLENCVLPLALDRYRCYELEKAYAQADTQQLKTKAIAQAEALMHEGLPKDAKMLSKNTATQILDDGSVRADIVITAEQNIAETKEF